MSRAAKRPRVPPTPLARIRAGSVCDVLCLVLQVRAREHVPGPAGRPLPARRLLVGDASAPRVLLTLWGASVDWDVRVGDVALISAVRITSFRRRLVSATTRGSTLALDARDGALLPGATPGAADVLRWAEQANAALLRPGSRPRELGPGVGPAAADLAPGSCVTVRGTVQLVTDPVAAEDAEGGPRRKPSPGTVFLRLPGADGDVELRVHPGHRAAAGVHAARRALGAVVEASHVRVVEGRDDPDQLVLWSTQLSHLAVVTGGASGGSGSASSVASTLSPPTPPTPSRAPGAGNGRDLAALARLRDGDVARVRARVAAVHFPSLRGRPLDARSAAALVGGPAHDPVLLTFELELSDASVPALRVTVPEGPAARQLLLNVRPRDLLMPQYADARVSPAELVVRAVAALTQPADPPLAFDLRSRCSEDENGVAVRARGYVLEGVELF